MRAKTAAAARRPAGGAPVAASRIARRAGGHDRRPRRAADHRLPQGQRRDPRPDRPHHDRRVVRQPPRGRAEGEFYFPLPQDASIAGFGMWIGDRLVEANVVEKQRARAIFETFLSRRLDPGLLEWTGGNLFKARVFPIPGKSEKRITITYTQFLPLRDGVYRYQYGLQSEMLKQNPLRQLEINVKVSSTVPLRNAASPSHATRNSRRPCGPRRVRGQGLCAGGRFRGRDRTGPTAVGHHRHSTPQWRRRLLHAATCGDWQQRQPACKSSSRSLQRAARPADHRRYVGLDGRRQSQAPGRVRRGRPGSTHREGYVQPGHGRR